MLKLSRLPKINFKLVLAIGAIAVSVGLPQFAPFVSHFITSYNSQSFNTETMNFSVDPQTKQARFGCTHQL